MMFLDEQTLATEHEINFLSSLLVSILATFMNSLNQ